MRSIDVAPLPIPELESHLDEVAGHLWWATRSGWV